MQSSVSAQNINMKKWHALTWVEQLVLKKVTRSGFCASEDGVKLYRVRERSAPAAKMLLGSHVALSLA